MSGTIRFLKTGSLSHHQEMEQNHDPGRGLPGRRSWNLFTAMERAGSSQPSPDGMAGAQKPN
jgi:hypothetical protein